MREIGSIKVFDRRNAPICYRKNVVTGLSDRAIRLSHGKSRPKNVTIIKTVLKTNKYPPFFYEPITKKRIYQLMNNNNTQIKPKIRNILTTFNLLSIIRFIIHQK